MKSGLVHTAITTMAFGLISLMALAEEIPSKESTPAIQAEKLGAGDHSRMVLVNEKKRYATVHVPPGYDPAKPIPLVLMLHGAGMSGEMMVSFTGMNETSDQNGFAVVYPDGTGGGPLFTWNAGGFVKGLGSRADDVGFIRKLLDDVESVVSIDPKRVYATGMSNGGMMCYRLAAELSDRFAAIAPVAGSMAVGDVQPKRPVSVIHFHGTSDGIVPFKVDKDKPPPLLQVRSAEDSVRTWAKLNGIENEGHAVQLISKEGDELKVTRQEFGPGKDGSEVILIVVEGGGHTWPGQPPPVEFLGKSTLDVSANDLIWAFFQKHARK